MFLGINNVSDYLEKQDPETQIRQAFSNAGVLYPMPLIMDGGVHRFHANPLKAKNNESGWYVFFDGEYPAGAFGDYSRDISVKVGTHGAKELTAEQLAERERMIREAKEKAEAVRAELAKKAAKESQERWEKAAECKNHAYLERKGLKQAYGARLYRGALIVPMYNKDGELVNLQSISVNKEDPTKFDKYFVTGGTCKGSYWFIGEGNATYLAEGFATAASIYEATGKRVIIAFSAGNLKEVAPLFPGTTIVADNDESGTGEKEAKATGLPYILIPEVGMDANDYCTKYGTLALEQILKPMPSYRLYNGLDLLSEPKPKSWIIRNWLPKGPAFCMTFGPSGNGKTFVVVDRMLSIATGQPDWCGNKITPCKVLYLCGEGSLDVRARIAVWCQEHHISKLENFYMSEEAAHIDSQDGMQRVLGALEYYNFEPDLIVVDTLNRFMEGDENDTQDAGSFISACAQLQVRYNACVSIVHHTGLAEDAQHRARGSSAFRGALDMQDMVTKNGDVFCIQQTKNKGGREQDPVYLQLVDHDIDGWLDEDGMPVSCATLVQTSRAEMEPKKSAKQIEDEELIINAFINAGYIMVDRAYIAKEKLKEQLTEFNPQWKNPEENLKKALRCRKGVFTGKLSFIERLVAYGDIEIDADKGYWCNDIVINGISQPYWSMSLRETGETKGNSL